MSEIRDSTASPSGETAKHYDKHAHTQGLKLNLVEYFQNSEQHQYFTSLNTGYCISSKCADDKSPDVQNNEREEKDEKKIYMFSRGTVHKRVHTILKRKIIGEIGKFAKNKNKPKHHIPSASQVYFKKRELVNKIVNIKHSLVCSLPGKLNANIKKPLKMSITLTKSSQNTRCHNKIGKCNPIGEFAPTRSGPRMQSNVKGEKSYKKLLRIMFSTTPFLKEMYNKYITFIEPYSEVERSCSKKFQRSAKFAATDYKSSYLLSFGTNPEYPTELNELFKPTVCDLCNVYMNSFKNAHRHYNSRSHKRRVNNWFCFMHDNGMDRPGLRFVGVDPTEYYCHLCTIKLPSSRHAIQHYNGRRHRAVVLKRTQLKGIGYFDLKGEWVETGKVIDTSAGKESAHIFVTTLTGIEQVNLYDASKVNSTSETEETVLNIPEIEDSEDEEAPNIEISQIAKKECREEAVISKQKSTSSDGKYSVKSEQCIQNTQNIESTHSCKTATDYSSLSTFQYCPGIDIYSTLPEMQTFSQALVELCCTLCNIKVTSRNQMLSHLKGSRHMKKMKLLGNTQPFVTIAESLELHDPKDLSIYRTPSGSYYCDMCKVAAKEPQHMKNHISSYSHRKMQRGRKMASKC